MYFIFRIILFSYVVSFFVGCDMPTIDGGDSSSIGQPMVSGGNDPVAEIDTAPVPDQVNIAQDYHFIKEDLPVASDLDYGGHVNFDTTPNYVDLQTEIYTDLVGIADHTITGTVQNLDISSYLEAGADDPKGALLYVVVYGQIQSTKVKEDGVDSTSLRVEAIFSNAYDSISSAYNVMQSILIKAEVDTVNLTGQCGGQSVVPVVWNGGTPYITWRVDGIFSDMVTNTGTLTAQCYIYLQGFLK